MKFSKIRSTKKNLRIWSLNRDKHRSTCISLKGAWKTEPSVDQYILKTLDDPVVMIIDLSDECLLKPWQNFPTPFHFQIYREFKGKSFKFHIKSAFMNVSFQCKMRNSINCCCFALLNLNNNQSINFHIVKQVLSHLSNKWHSPSIHRQIKKIHFCTLAKILFCSFYYTYHSHKMVIRKTVDLALWIITFFFSFLSFF